MIGTFFTMLSNKVYCPFENLKAIKIESKMIFNMILKFWKTITIVRNDEKIILQIKIN